MARHFLRLGYHLKGGGTDLFFFLIELFISIRKRSFRFITCNYTTGFSVKENWVWNSFRDKNHYQAQSHSCYAIKYSVTPHKKKNNHTTQVNINPSVGYSSLYEKQIQLTV